MYALKQYLGGAILISTAPSHFLRKRLVRLPIRFFPKAPKNFIRHTSSNAYAKVVSGTWRCLFIFLYIFIQYFIYHCLVFYIILSGMFFKKINTSGI